MKANPSELTSDLSAEILKARRTWNDIVQAVKVHYYNQDYYIQQLFFKMKGVYNRDTCIPMFIVSLFTIAKSWNQLRCPTVGE
jgi:hypothetical protein